MKIKGKVHCFFEQTGTFKNEFLKLGITSEDYDIQNNFGETDNVIDLFDEIDLGFAKKESIFDEIDNENDLIFSFFPCIEFSCTAQTWYSLTEKNYKKWPYIKRIEYMIRKNQKRARLYELCIKMTGICLERKIRMIMENPWAENTYLKNNVFLKKPTLIDRDRSKRGDYFHKPTAYWFWNCTPTYGQSFEPTPRNMIKSINSMKSAPRAGLCSQERSMISPRYAKNFICDFILGQKQPHTMQDLFL